jgi:peptide/nickel transport system substrate-binding protein
VRKVGAYLVSVLRSLGYKARLRAFKSVEAYHAARDAGQVVIGPTRSSSAFPAASDLFISLLSCKTAPNPALNRAAFCDPRIDREVQQARAIATDDPQAAAVARSRIDRAVMKEAPWIPIANGTQDDLISRRVGNYQFNPFWGVLLDQLWVR